MSDYNHLSGCIEPFKLVESFQLNAEDKREIFTEWFNAKKYQAKRFDLHDEHVCKYQLNEFAAFITALEYMLSGEAHILQQQQEVDPDLDELDDEIKSIYECLKGLSKHLKDYDGNIKYCFPMARYAMLLDMNNQKFMDNPGAEPFSSQDLDHLSDLMDDLRNGSLDYLYRGLRCRVENKPTKDEEAAAKGNPVDKALLVRLAKFYLRHVGKPRKTGRKGFHAMAIIIFKALGKNEAGSDNYPGLDLTWSAIDVALS